ncbi:MULTISPECIES: type VI secretion system protein TssA [unclassified Cupriavidus]|uniref:type VI secretion system protein TssA n=1 Tax=unclassified Cupriavidus TaxID=2640874 RepID=UPI001BFFDF9C|nr:MULTISPECIES: type VI secretion system protein TssA [unclassified Cupriavidus]MCA3185672.1 type VI secretion system protein TssA [Cupriavidus sp.]MCA3194031.1 type VI secretion system protein TssA [Cupriavidus sp.]MCA3200329.1 type VI secretion system protein TssA [Cupriavidus sp.]MCA3208751.1 type VI secretion system protein TssA [Cupriavidus sp.]MCA3235746.1 type VI secretion system protein TssA [Cupriavidus sp.]
MFNNLLNALFGTNAPADLARSTQARWESWLQPIRPDAPVGDDPGYDDDFIAIKEEVAKLSDINDTVIVESSESLLKQNAKDVRLAVYYAYGRMRRDGAEGVASAFELLSALIDRFGDQLLPVRAESRKAALEWLAGATFTDRLDRVSGLTGTHLERTLSALALIQEQTAQWPAAGRPALHGLFRRFEGRIESPPSDNGAGQAAAAMPSAPATTLAPGDVTSSRDLLDCARRMAQFLREQPEGYLAAYRLMRCVRWDTLTEVPPSEAGGKTRLVAPRAELRAQMKRLVLQKQWPQLLDRVEQAFAEGANHFWLDLQYYAFTAQDHAGGHYAQVRDLLATDCALMLERLPGLAQLAFADGSPFADDTTLEWIASHATVRDIAHGESVSPVTVSSASTDWAETEAQAVEMAAQQSLDAALAWLQDLPAPDGERDRFVRQLVMARVAERADRVDTALHLLAALDARATQFRLDAWEPSLAFEVKQQLLRLLKIRATRKDADKIALAQRIDALTGELTTIDPARAVAIT